MTRLRPAPTDSTRREALRRVAGAACLGVVGVGSATRAAAATPRETLRLSYQRSSTLLTILKHHGTLETKLAPLGFDVSWHELTGSALLTALNTGSVDLHADVADAYALFTQAASAPLTYYAKETAAPSAQAILVQADGPIRSVAELKGKRVAVTKGAGVHYLLIAALKQAGLTPAEVDVRFLDAQDGVAAFANGSVDAAVVWDPFLATQQRGGKVRVLADGSGGLVEYNRFYTATTSFAQRHPEVLQLVFGALQTTGRWVKAQPADAAAILAPLWGQAAPETVALVNSRRSYQIVPVRSDQLAEQQRIADAFREAGLIPKPLRAADIRVWTAPDEAVQATALHAARP
jgi:sulfonate transport system substrate-binding protein